MSEFRGIYNIVPTPFDESGAIDKESLRRLIDFVIGTGVDGLTILGFLGEAAKLTEAERAMVIDVTVEVTDDRAPVQSLGRGFATLDIDSPRGQSRT